MMAAQNDNDGSDKKDTQNDIDYDTNLLSLGADAWDDSALIEAFDRDLKFYQTSHRKQLLDLSKVSNLINFNIAKKINENIENQNNEDDEDDYDDDDDHDAVILAPSFIPFASQTTQLNDQSGQMLSQKRSKQQDRQHQNLKQQKTNNNNNNDGTETENLAELYAHQQQKPHTSPPEYASAAYYQPYYTHYPQPHQQPPPQQMVYPGNPARYPAMPPYAHSAMFNIGLNMMPPPSNTHSSPSKDEALANMLLAWYWNGYYAGHQAATNRK